MVGTRPIGRIRRGRNGAAKIHLKLSREDIAAIRTGQVMLSRIFLAGGAREVLPGLFADLAVRSEADLAELEHRIRRSDDVFFGSAHPQGGNPMSDDPSRGVIASDFRVHGFDNLTVVDASVMPLNIWANCQAMVMALAHVAADTILGT